MGIKMSELSGFIAAIKNVPTPIEFYVEPIIPTPIPSELRNLLGKNLEDFRKIRTILISLTNLSKSSLKDVRIKLPSKPEYNPYLRSSQNGEKIHYEWKS